MRSWPDVGLMALRIGLGVTFILFGWMKLSNHAMTATAFADWGVPLASFSAWLVGIVEFVGGLMVLLGIYLRLAAKLHAIVLIVALAWVHWRLGHAFQMWALPFVMLGGSLALAGVGGGKWKVTKKDCCCGEMAACDTGMGMGKGCGCGGNCNCGDKHMHMDDKKDMSGTNMGGGMMK